MVSEADAGALDRPIWSALTTGNRSMALANGAALRYPADIAPFAALREPTPAGFADLKALLPAEGRAVFFTVDPVTPPPDLEATVLGVCNQMIAMAPAAGSAEGPDSLPMVTLGAADVPDMLALVEMTRPGPFAMRTHQLGRYLGIRDGGELIAMAGERMRLDGYVEVSAVCVHPGHRGRGYARRLIVAVMEGIAVGGATPFLHTYTDNAAAVGLYEQLGFEIRQRLRVTVLTHAAV